MRASLLLTTLACFVLSAWSCDPDKCQNGCMIYANSCICGYGLKTEYVYKTKRACRNALKAMAAPPPERSSNICSNMPCSRGICTQTTNELGYACKCEGTGFYGQRCERACPTSPIRDMVFPHECIVI